MAKDLLDELEIYDETEDILEDLLDDKESEADILDMLKPFLKKLNKIDRTIEKKVEDIANYRADKADTETNAKILKLSQQIQDKLDSIKDGKDYILTDQDKKDIAKNIKVPVVEKIIEKREIVKEVPIVTNEIKEIAKYETGEQIVDKINQLPDQEEYKIDVKHIKGLDQKGKTTYIGVKHAINGVKEGGTTGQKLVKKSNQDYDTEWVDDTDLSGYYTEIDSSSSQFRLPQYSTGNTADNYPAYSFSQDPDTGMLLFADGKLGFATGADTKMLIDGSNVGIGKVTGISSTLDVNGSFALPIRTSAVNTTLTSSDYTVILTSPSRVVTLPSPVLNRIYVVSNRSNGVCSITGNIDGTVQTITIPAYESYQLQATSTTWYVNSSNSAKLYSQSRGLSLVTNGTGLLGTNENFSSLTYDPIEVYSGRASFKTSIANTTFVSNELIPVDLNKKYRLTVYAKSTTYVAGNKAYFGIQPTDIDGLLVSPQNYKRISGTDTTLASELKAGDTTITLTSASGWQTSNANAYNRQAIFWNYSNSQGYQYPAYTYSRNNTALNYGGSYSTAGLWAVGGITGNVITLTSAWTGATIPAGTPVSNASSSGTYKYIAASNLEVPNTWTKFSGCIQGIDEEGLASNVQFPYGTAFVQIIGLLNRDVTGNVTNISNISFQEDVDSGDMRIINQTGTHYVDFLNDNYVDMTLTGNTTLLKGITPNKNITEVVKYIIRGSFTLSFGPEFSATYPISGTYNGAKDNLVTLTCMNINGTFKYKATIEN